MLVGLLLGALADETLTASLLGALIGLGVGQALKLQGLERENAALTAQLKAFSLRFEQGTTALYERLLKLEQGATSAPEPSPEVEPLSAVTEPEPEPIAAAQAAEPELDWTLDFVLPESELAPVAAMQAAAPPVAEPVTPRQAAPKKTPEPRQPSPIERAIDLAQGWQRQM